MSEQIKGHDCPFIGWVLSPSFKPIAKTFGSRYESYSDWHGYNVDGGGLYAFNEIYLSKADAIAAGWRRVHEQQAALTKKQANLAKKVTALEKAAKEQP